MSEAPPRKAWFRAKRYGYGAGLPIAWEGWALLLIWFGALVLLAQSFIWIAGKLEPALFSVLAILICLPFLYVARSRTEGGWRARWGNK